VSASERFGAGEICSSQPDFRRSRVSDAAWARTHGADLDFAGAETLAAGGGEEVVPAFGITGAEDFEGRAIERAGFRFAFEGVNLIGC